MDSDLKRRWIEALESGTYKKGEAFLREHIGGVDRWCCLGVLCDLVDTDGWRKVELPHHAYYQHSDGGSGFLSPTVRNTVFPDAPQQTYVVEEGMREHPWTDVEHDLSTLNDASDTFDPVIEYIKEKL